MMVMSVKVRVKIILGTRNMRIKNDKVSRKNNFWKVIKILFLKKVLK